MRRKTTPIQYDQTPIAGFAIYFGLVFVASIAGILYFAPGGLILDPVGLLNACLASIPYTIDVVFYGLKIGDMNQAMNTASKPALGIAGIIAADFLGLMLPIAVFVARQADKRNPNESKFATASDIKKMGLDGKLGPILGQAHGKLLRPYEPRHVLIIAPTRAGKTAQVISAILDYPGTVICIDPKDEIRKITEPHRSTMGKTHCISWADPKTRDGWNPFAVSILSKDIPTLERDAARLAGVLVPTPANAEFWDKAALRNATSLCLYEMCEAIRTGVDGHLRNILEYLQDLPEYSEECKDPFAYKMAELAAHGEAHGFPEMVIRDLTNLGRMEHRQRDSHVETLLTRLQYFRFSATYESLNKSSFTWQELRSDINTVYIDFPQADAQAFGHITAVFIDTLLSWALTVSKQENDYPILIVMDEFRDMPYMHQLPSAMTRGAGAGVTLMPIIQGIPQLKERYKDSWENIRINVEYIVVYETPDYETARILQEIIGKTTIERLSTAKRAGEFKANKTYTDAEDYLIRASEFGIIPFGKHIVLARRHQIRPIYADTVLWFKFPQFTKLIPKERRIKT